MSEIELAKAIENLSKTFETYKRGTSFGKELTDGLNSINKVLADINISIIKLTEVIKLSQFNIKPQ